MLVVLGTRGAPPPLTLMFSMRSRSPSSRRLRSVSIPLKPTDGLNGAPEIHPCPRFGTWGTYACEGEFGGFAEADDSGDVFGAGAALAFVGAAEEERLDLGSAADVEGADSLGRVHLVAGDGEQVAADLLHVDGELAGCLDGVGVEIDVGFGGDLADLFDGLDRAGLVVGHHDADELGIRPERAAHVGRIDDAFAAYGQKGHLDAALCQALGGVEDGVVFDGRGDEVVAGLDESEDGEIVALGASAGEDDLGGAAVQQRGDRLAGVLDGGAGVLAVEVDRRGVAEGL